MTGRRHVGCALAVLSAALLGDSLLAGARAAVGTGTAAPSIVAAAVETVTLAVDGMT